MFPIRANPPGKARHLVILGGLGLALAGCSSFRTEMGRPLAGTTAEFAEGRTRVEDVVHRLGPPNQVSRISSGIAFLYEYTKLGEIQLGFSIDFALLRYFKFL